MDFTTVPAPDAEAEHAARSRQDILTKPQGALGRLEDLSVWVVGVPGRLSAKAVHPRPRRRLRR